MLGASISLSAGEEGLTEAYRDFKEEACDLDPDYQPKTVNTDGWSATQAAWQALFPGIVVILCFLHAFLKIRDRAKRLATIFPELAQKEGFARVILGRLSSKEQQRFYRQSYRPTVMGQTSPETAEPQCFGCH